MRFHVSFVLACALAVAGCGVDPDAVPPGEEAPAPPEPATLDLEAAGIIIPPQDGFEQLDVPFGSSRIGTEATLANVLGDPVASYEADGDCGLARVEFEGLTINFDKANEFVGYYATAPFVPKLSRAEMLADEQVTPVQDSTLGEEFLIGDASGPVIAGLFASAEDSAPVSSLWAGENCIFR